LSGPNDSLPTALWVLNLSLVNNKIMLLYKDECDFPLAEKQKKLKTFFSHTAGSLGSSVWVFRSHGLCEEQFCMLPPAIA